MYKIKNKINSLSKKDVIRSVSGIIIICLVLLINGFMSFINVGFDFTKIKTMSYWANFALTLFSEMAVLIGMYIIRKPKDLQNKKIANLQNEIDKKRTLIYSLDKVDEAENWLREVLNYQTRLNIYERKIKEKYENLRVREPAKHERAYERKIKKYMQKLELKKHLLNQLELIKIDRKKIDCFLHKDMAQYQKFNQLLENGQYELENSKIKFKQVYWDNLLSDVENSETIDGSPYFSEKKQLTKNVSKYVAVGLISSSFIASLIFPTFNMLGWNTVVSLLVNFITLLIFMTRGVWLSNKIILGDYYCSLDKRKTIYNKMLKDLGISKVIFEDEENEEVNDGTEEKS